MGCCGNITDEALGHPKGTVRALLALILSTLTFSIAGAVVIILIVKYEQYSLAISILGTLFGIVAVIITFYFAAKSGEKATKTVSDGYERMMDSKQSEIAMLQRNNRDLFRQNPNAYFQPEREDDVAIEMIGPQRIN